MYNMHIPGRVVFMIEEFHINCSRDTDCLCRDSFDRQIAGELDPLRREYRKIGHLPEVNSFAIDLSGIRACDNYGCLAIPLLCEMLSTVFPDAEQKIKLPSSGPFVNDFFSGGFLALLKEFLEWKSYGLVGRDFHTSSGRMYIPQRIISLDCLPNFFTQIKRGYSSFLRENKNSIISDFSTTAYERIAPFLSIGMELTQNIIHHSQHGQSKPPTGYASFLFTLDRVEIAIMDLGVGIPGSFGNPNPTADESFDFIHMACQENYSRYGEDRGLGLYVVRDIVRKLNGILSIRSGKATAVFDTSNNFSGVHAKGFEIPFFRGTQIQITIPFDHIGKERCHEFEVLDF